MRCHDLARELERSYGANDPHAVAARKNADYLAQCKQRWLRDAQRKMVANDV
jgi:hypothetical protein